MIIKRKDLAQLLDAVAAERTLIAPRNVDGVSLYRPVEDSTHVVWDYIRPTLSAKEAFFPATERLLTIKKTGQDIELNQTLPEGQQVIFGLRPCDARGILALDAVFLDKEPVDSYYQERRQNTTLIGLACEEMGETCFCTTMGSAPNDPSGMDIMLTPVDSGFELQAYSDKGTLFLGDLGLQIEKIAPVNPQSAIDFPQPTGSASKFNFQYWVEMSERCLSCRVCAYVCPTCRCFDVRDEALAGNGGGDEFERIRCWDSCAGEIYRRVAGGHNPRAAKAQRMRNRFQCKIYYYPQQYGPLACTGCGRCIDSCPVNIDITEIMDHLAEVSA
mgnify:CR=1 FL=1